MKKFLASALALMMLLTSCAPAAQTENSSVDPAVNSVKAPSSQLTYVDSEEMVYAQNLQIDNFNDGYKLVTLLGEDKFLIVPEGKEIPEDLDESVTPLCQPINNILVSSTPTVSLINSIGALDRVSLTTNDKDTWLIPEVVSAMDNGSIKYIGEYDEPDYEKILENKPPLAVYSNMMSFVPEVAEKFDELGIPYILDHSSSEPEPMARVEWVKLYGALFNMEEEAQKVFDQQVEYISSIPTEKTGKTVAIFYITSKGIIYARNSGDYMVKMAEMAGADYICSDLGVGETGTTSMEAEEFYSRSKDADYVIYVWSVGGKPKTLEDIYERMPIFEEFKAVKEGNVWCTSPDFFQISDTIGYFIKDMNTVFNLQPGQQADVKYLNPIK